MLIYTEIMRIRGWQQQHYSFGGPKMSLEFEHEISVRVYNRTNKLLEEWVL